MDAEYAECTDTEYAECTDTEYAEYMDLGNHGLID